MTHNGVDIDQFILLTVYPTVTFFIIGVITNRLSIGEVLKFALQGASCIIFAIVYLIAIPNGGAQGLALVLILFGGILFLMARKYVLHPADNETHVGEKEQQGDTRK